MRKLFFDFCGGDSGYERLTYPAFCKLLNRVVPSKTFTQRQMTALFREVNSIDDIDTNDAITPEMWLSFARHHGFVAPMDAE